MKIGLEVHVELNTDTKLFCSCQRNSEEPNSSTCPVCLGHPGTRPRLNKKVVEYAVQVAKSLSFDLEPRLEFSRKNYFYPDLSKNYQITQYNKPVGKNGSLRITQDKTVTLKRIHVEEDPASTLYPRSMTKSEYTLLDYNRAGTPLLEIVTTPCIKTPGEARQFLNELTDLLTYLDVFNPENSNIKADANISIKETGYERIEIKNITGFKAIETALHYEKTRQKALLRRGRTVTRETRTWDATSKTTRPMRQKETEAEYGYIKEPDLPRKTHTQKYIDTVTQVLPELPQQRIQRYHDDYNIPRGTAKILTKNQRLGTFFEDTKQYVDNPVTVANWVRREILKVLKDTEKTLKETQITPKNLGTLLSLLEQERISETTAQQLTRKLQTQDLDIERYVEQNGLEQVSNSEDLQRIVEAVIKSNEEAVSDYTNGEEKALHYLLGQVMKETRGQANPEKTKTLMEQALKEV